MKLLLSTLPEAEAMTEKDEEFPLHGDILERILEHLPLVYLLSARRVSRSWCHAVHSSLRYNNPTKPWLILHPLSLSATAYDPYSRIWLRLHRPAGPMIPNTGNIRSSGNMLYAISPFKISFSLDPFHINWHHLDGPLVWRADPIVALVGRRIIVAGGACDFADDPLAVETYDLDAGTWSSCDSMPSVLRDCPASTCLSVAAVGDVMYVMEKATCVLHAYNAQQMSWHGPIDLGIAREASWWVIGAMRGGLVAVGGKGGSPKGVTVMQVDVETWRVSEIGEMPEEMSGKFSVGRSMGVCCSDQEFAYLYGDGVPSEVAWCEMLGKGVCRWGWVEGVFPFRAGVMTCADVGFEELGSAMTGQGLLLVEEKD